MWIKYILRTLPILSIGKSLKIVLPMFISKNLSYKSRSYVSEASIGFVSLDTNFRHSGEIFFHKTLVNEK